MKRYISRDVFRYQVLSFLSIFFQTKHIATSSKLLNKIVWRDLEGLNIPVRGGLHKTDNCVVSILKKHPSEMLLQKMIIKNTINGKKCPTVLFSNCLRWKYEKLISYFLDSYEVQCIFKPYEFEWIVERHNLKLFEKVYHYKIWKEKIRWSNGNFKNMYQYLTKWKDVEFLLKLSKSYDIAYRTMSNRKDAKIICKMYENDYIYPTLRKYQDIHSIFTSEVERDVVVESFVKSSKTSTYQRKQCFYEDSLELRLKYVKKFVYEKWIDIKDINVQKLLGKLFQKEFDKREKREKRMNMIKYFYENKFYKKDQNVLNIYSYVHYSCDADLLDWVLDNLILETIPSEVTGKLIKLLLKNTSDEKYIETFKKIMKIKRKDEKMMFKIRFEKVKNEILLKLIRTDYDGKITILEKPLRKYDYSGYNYYY